uniref:Uncharacterized protein n=1 Tax=Physcomitrium patens TaxID=3218 RepID=A0A7I4CJ32_PHYPA
MSCASCENAASSTWKEVGLDCGELSADELRTLPYSNYCFSVPWPLAVLQSQNYYAQVALNVVIRSFPFIALYDCG